MADMLVTVRGDAVPGPEVPDRALARLAARGDRGALTVLLDRHAAALFNHCRYLVRDIEDAEDIYQETMARAFSSVDSLRDPGAFRGWLFSIARHLAVDLFRGRTRSCALPEGDTLPGGQHEESPLERIEVREEQRAVAQAIGKLTSKHQKLLVLREVDGMTYAEIADHLGVSMGSVESALLRARRRLRVEYERVTGDIGARSLRAVAV